MTQAKDEALKLALEALEGASIIGGQRKADEAIAAIKQALAEPVQEPVGALILGGVIDTSDGPEYEEWDVEWNTKAVEALQEKLVTSNGVTLMLYTTPPAASKPWTGLTDDEAQQIRADCATTPPDLVDVRYGWAIHYARVIEAKLKEKNT
jgi:hypothetical protein